jgi:hypothetical protein
MDTRSSINDRLGHKDYHPYQRNNNKMEIGNNNEDNNNVSMRVLLLTWLCIRMKLRCP